jgi:hypothetical protein
MNQPDRLYELLPVVYRQRDTEQGYPLKALLRVIAEQVDVVEDDIKGLYENWFVETCEDWVVPYLGELIGYRPVHEAGEPGDPRMPQARLLNKILIPRREVANTIAYRRRKGTLSLLELLGNNVAGWPARAVEFYKLLGRTQHLNHQRLRRERTVNLRDSDSLAKLDGPFDPLAHTVDVRRANSRRSQGRFNIPSVGLFVWRLKAYSVTQSPAYYLDDHPDCYTFSVLGNDTPLYNRPQPEAWPTQIAHELNLPTPIQRRAFHRRKAKYYAEDKSLQIWIGTPRQPIPADKIVAANLSGWHYRPTGDRVAVDPVRGRITFAPGKAPSDQVVWVSYHYAFADDIGGGEYNRILSQPVHHTLYPVGEGETDKTINDALNRWRQQKTNSSDQRLQNAVIEITDSGLYEERINVQLGKSETLQIRAANRKRPVISLSDTRARQDALFIAGEQGSRITLDGLLIVGRGVKISGAKATTKSHRADRAGNQANYGDLCHVKIRHCTLVPGWSLDCDCQPCRAEEPSITLDHTSAHLTVERSIIGSIEVFADESRTTPVRVKVSDTIWDATKNELPALSGRDDKMAYTRLTVARCTVFGEIHTHEIALAENAIFNGSVYVARRQGGCMRFCYVPPESRTPRRYECQPDLVRNVVMEKFLNSGGAISPAERDAELAREELRVTPQFNSTRYGTPAYCQLAETCAEEIKRGADDESEMGAFHDLFQPQRAANLRSRLDEFTPAGMNPGIIFAS